MSFRLGGAVAVVAAMGLLSIGCPRTPSAPTFVFEPGAVPQGKLPDGVRPTRYRLSLEVVPSRDVFSGTAMITIELDEPQRMIWMHGERLRVSSIHATHATTRIDAVWEQKTADGVASVTFAETIPSGRTTLHVEYDAPFDAPLRGLYRVSSGGNTYAFTQFESISARLAFPCFDEPRFKTPFELTLTVPADHFVAANTPIESAIRIPDDLQRVSFAPTPPLPTYLVAFVVGPFDVASGVTIAPDEVRSTPIPLRGIAAAGKGPLLSHALERTPSFVEALERYFRIAYPYEKLDLVAVPDFAAGAMENVGLITFREWLLLLDASESTEGQRRAFAYVMAHELAHQWFGNLVTMPWWDDIWLNEAFATWMGDKVVHELHPEYRSDLSSLASSHRAMAYDSLTSARSIRQPILSNHDIENAFDAITYLKGGAVLSMFEHWMGPEVFREGIQLYLSRHRTRTATSSDLLAALDEASPLDVARPFLTFLTQPGVPLLRARADDDCNGGDRRIHLSQERYLPLGSRGSAAQTWEIPLCMRHENGSTCGALAAARGHLDLPGCPTWWMPNERGSGYFRFSMPASDWARLRSEGFSQLSDAGKLAVADSLYSELDRGSLEVEQLFPWFQSFVSSPIRQLVIGPTGALRFMMAEAASDETRPKIATYGARLYRKRYRQLGWRARPGETSDTKLLRGALVRWMVMDVRDPRARARAARLGRLYAGYGVAPDAKAVDPQLADLVLAAAVQEGDERFFDHLVAQLEASTDATERSRILAALGHAESETLSRRALGLTLDPRLRLNETSSILGVQLRNPRTRKRAWAWMKENFDAFVARAGSAQVGGAPWYTASLCSYEDAEDVQGFFEPRVDDLPGGPRNLAGAVEAIRLCAAKAEALRPEVAQAFR